MIATFDKSLKSPSAFAVVCIVLISQALNLSPQFQFVIHGREEENKEKIPIKAWGKMGIPSEMRDLLANRRKSLLIPSPMEDEKILRSRQCTQG